MNDADQREEAPMDGVSIRLFHVDNGDGWRLALRRYSADTLRRSGRPLIILPGYGMNSFIFNWHPEGVSMAEFFARQGFEFWTVDLRAQGDSVPDGGSPSYLLQDVGITDLGAVIEHVLGHTQCVADRVDVMGCSLGATYAFIHVALVPDHRIGAMVALGGPLRWTKTHPVLRLAFSSPTLAGLVPFWGTSMAAELALPFVARRLPWLLSIYLRIENVDVDKAPILVRTVEDPVPAVNAQVAEWMRSKDLIIDGRNITDEMANFTGPFFCAFGNADGIVPRSTATSAFTAVGSKCKELLELGDDQLRMAHADIYISRYSHERVFRPVADWLSGVEVA